MICNCRTAHARAAAVATARAGRESKAGGDASVDEFLIAIDAEELSRHCLFLQLNLLQLLGVFVIETESDSLQLRLQIRRREVIRPLQFLVMLQAQLPEEASGLVDVRLIIPDQLWRTNDLHELRHLQWRCSGSRRCGLLIIEPGSGKSSLVMAIATELAIPIYWLQLSTEGLTDETLVQQLQGIRERPCLLLHEDIDRSHKAALEEGQKKEPGEHEPATSVRASQGVSS